MFDVTVWWDADDPDWVYVDDERVRVEVLDQYLELKETV